jgi:hypothetical protein
VKSFAKIVNYQLIAEAGGEGDGERGGWGEGDGERGGWGEGGMGRGGDGERGIKKIIF